MENSDSISAGVNRTHGRSLPQKWAFTIGHFAIVSICAWLIFGNGWATLTDATGKPMALSDLPRAQVLLACAFIYWLRHGITLFYLLARKVEWSEVLGLLGFIAVLDIGLLLVGGGAFRQNPIDLGWLDLLAAILFVFGSYLNSFSEIQRKWWKANPANKGHCYTQGLFSHSMHINYFGDVLLFAGWCLFTYNYWTLAFPLLMAAAFVFFHIPGLDSYLADRYGKEFQAYAANTKKFVPFIY